MAKNDEAWQQFFDETHRLAEIRQKGYCHVLATELKEKTGREARLMAKLDTLAVRPKIFKENSLTIFPVENGKYVLFEDPDERSYYSFSSSEQALPARVFQSHVDLTAFDSYPRNQNLSESQAIDFAYVASLIKHFTKDEHIRLTIRGRLRSGSFHFNLPTNSRRVDVSGVQIEVDAGYESLDAIYLIEAKVGKRDNFHIRQLYYPYLEWSNRSNKRIVPIFLAYSNGKFFLYEFSLSQDFGALQAVRSECFSINESPIAHLRIEDLFRAHEAGEEPDVPYPQANDLDKVVDLVSLVEQGTDTKSEIADTFEFDERQGDYYANAGRYLGLLDRYGHEFRLTDLGRQLTQTRSTSAKSQLIVEQLLARPTFRKAFDLLLSRDFQLDDISNKEIAAIICESGRLSGTTPLRRASTVRSWLRWVLENSQIVP